MVLRSKALPQDADILNDAINKNLKSKDIQRVCELINDEYMMNGIREDYSPNEYGKDLNTLLNSVNEPRLR